MKLWWKASLPCLAYVSWIEHNQCQDSVLCTTTLKFRPQGGEQTLKTWITNHEDHIDHWSQRICKEVVGCAQAIWRLTDLIQPPTCLCKEVGDYLIRCALPRQSLELTIITHPVTHKGRYRAARAAKNIGIETPGSVVSLAMFSLNVFPQTLGH